MNFCYQSLCGSGTSSLSSTMQHKHRLMPMKDRAERSQVWLHFAKHLPRKATVLFSRFNVALLSLLWKSMKEARRKEF